MKKDKISGKIKRLKSRLACVLLFFLLCSSITAQEALLKTEYSYRRYTTQDGLPQMAMESILKDNRGFLWQGTYNGGSSFDGFDFKPYSSDKFPNIDRIEEIDGKIRFFWGHDLFYPKTEKLITLSDSININPYNSYSLPAGFYIFENQEGYKYFVKMVKDTISDIIDIPQLQGLYRCKVYFDSQENKLYIPNNGKKAVIMYNINTKNTQIIEDIIIESFINHSQLGLLGIGKEGIFKIEDNKAKLYIPLQFEMQNKIAKETRNGDMYIKDFFNIYRISGEQVEHLYHNSSLQIWDMALDDDENLWIATNKGLYNFFHFNFKNYKIPNHNIESVTQDESGTFWFAGDNEDIFSFANDNFKSVQYPLNPKLQSLTFQYAFSHNNNTYFLMRGGILIHEDTRFYWADMPVDNKAYVNVVVYKDHLLVRGTNTVLEMTHDGKVIKRYTEKQLKQEGNYGLAVDKNNRIIIGGDDGISIVDNENVTVLKNQSTAYSEIVCVDIQNHIFSAARKYLNLVDGDSIRTVYSFDDDYITGLLPFDHENMIISTLKGFYIFNSKKYFETGKIQLLFYNHNNGMDGIQPAFSELFLDKNKNVWMVTSEKIVSFNPQKLLRQIAAPNLIFQNFAVSTDNVNWKNIDNFANAAFSYKNKNFKFSYIGLNFSAVENVRYHYRLPGFQNEWSDPVKTREVTFNNLPPGDYTFEIYADAGTEESRSKTESFTFSIKPAFWQTSWFLVLLILSLVSLSFLISLVFLQRKNRALLEKLRTEKELNELHISSIRLKAIPHFNANVLAAIEYYIANRTKAEAMRILGIYSNFTLKTLSDIDKAARPLSEELDYVKMYLDLEKVRFLEKFDFQINVEDGVDENVQLPNMILHTYCENAVKHGLMPLKSGGRLSINVSQQGQIMCVDVEDNGVGRESAARNPHLHSTKQGLSILNRQIEIYNRFNREKIQQQTDDLSSAGKPSGTRFSVKIPLSFTYIT